METLKLDLAPRIYSADESAKLEKTKREQISKTMCSFGISYFDHALSGNYANDVTLLGAKSGAGKTECATLIGLENAKRGRRVIYFALEAEDQEIIRRIKFKYISKFFYENRSAFDSNIKLRYQDWYYYKFNGKLDLAEKYANEEVSKLGSNFRTVYRTKNNYTAEDFKKHFFSLVDTADMFIVDHVHYFDSDEQNENKALKETMKAIRDCALIGGKAVILVAHLRKSDTKNPSIIPTLEDFHGSSDLAKIATKAIAIAPAYGMPNIKSQYPTYFKVLKNRVGSDCERYAALGYFDIATNTYDLDYTIGTISQNGFEQLKNIPEWANKMKIKNEFGKTVGYGE